MVKHILPAAFVIALFGSYLSAQTKQPLQSGAASSDSEIPQVTVVSQPESALSVNSSSRWAIPGHRLLDLFVVVKNTSTKSIRAYTTLIDFQTTQEPEQYCMVENIYSPGKVLKTEQKDGKSRFLGINKDVSPVSIQVSIDYIEFTDGSAWGLDRCQTTEYLRGERVGGNAALEWFQKLLREKGPEATVEGAVSNSMIQLRSSGASAKWEEGYWRGVQTIIQRITSAYQKEGEAELEVVLRKPFDAASGVRP